MSQGIALIKNKALKEVLYSATDLMVKQNIEGLFVSW